MTISEYSQYNNSETKNSLWETQSNADEIKYINQLMYLGTFFYCAKGFQLSTMMARNQVHVGPCLKDVKS